MDVMDALKDAGSTALENLGNQLKTDAAGIVQKLPVLKPASGTTPADTSNLAPPAGSTETPALAVSTPKWVWWAVGVGGVLVLITVIAAVSARKG